MTITHSSQCARLSYGGLPPPKICVFVYDFLRHIHFITENSKSIFNDSNGTTSSKNKEAIKSLLNYIIADFLRERCVGGRK